MNKGKYNILSDLNIKSTKDTFSMRIKRSGTKNVSDKRLVQNGQLLED